VLFPYLDASAAVKRYVSEPGTVVVDHLFVKVPSDRLVMLSVGYGEVASILVRKRNAGLIPPAVLLQSVRDVRSGFGPSSPVQLIDATGDLADRALEFIDRHSVNSTDAMILRSALDLAAALRPAGDDVLLVSCDLRLIKAAQA
jgi:predicted nucleic acid-binding protein